MNNKINDNINNSIEYNNNFMINPKINLPDLKQGQVKGCNPDSNNNNREHTVPNNHTIPLSATIYNRDGIYNSINHSSNRE